MGSISSASAFSVLYKYLNESDTNRSVRETCETAIAKVEWDHSKEGQRHLASTITEPQSVVFSFSVRCLIDLTLFRTYTSVDPHPPRLAFLREGQELQQYPAQNSCAQSLSAYTAAV